MSFKATRRLAPALALCLADTAGAHPIPTEISARIDASSAPVPGEPTLAEIRTATERYRHAAVALAEGYVRAPSNMCDIAEMMRPPATLGAMGIHAFRPDLLGITAPADPRVDANGSHTDFHNPAVLIYERKADGSFELVAVENRVFALGPTGLIAPPRFHGVAWDAKTDDPATAVDEAHGFEPHYDRHVWLYHENPNGVFGQYNPKANCRDHAGGGAAHAHTH